MKRTLSSWRIGLVAGVLAVVIAGAAVYAAIPSATGVISACYSMFGGSVRIIDREAGATCFGWEKGLAWNQIGAQIYMNRNFQDLSLADFPGVTTASLRLPAGSYVMWAKFRYRNFGEDTKTASCVFQGAGIGGLDASEHHVSPGGAATGTVDGIMMDMLIKQKGDDPEVHVQCFGPETVHIINTQFVAIPTGALILQP